MLNQTLTTEQIEAMKEANMGGDEIVTALLANSGTFETKTEYSQVATPIQSPKHARVTIISRQGVGCCRAVQLLASGGPCLSLLCKAQYSLYRPLILQVRAMAEREFRRQICTID